MFKCRDVRTNKFGVIINLSFQQKKCIHICVPSYFINTIVYIILYVNVHFCLYKSAKNKTQYFITISATKNSNLQQIDTIYNFKRFFDFITYFIHTSCEILQIKQRIIINSTFVA